jgi:hypothetical protein
MTPILREARILTVVAALAALAAGCGKGAPPTISDLTLTATVSRGGQLDGQVKVSDPDGLGGLKMALRMAGPGVQQPEQTIGVANASDAIKEALLPFALLISAQAPPGSYSVTIAALDGDGERSNELTSSFTVK